MFRSFILAAVLAVFTIGSASATNLDTSVDVHDPAEWTGAYVQLFGGVGAVTLDPDLFPLGADGRFIGGSLGYDHEISGNWLIGVRGSYEMGTLDLGTFGAGIDEDFKSYSVMGRVGKIVGAERATLIYVGLGHRWNEMDPVAGLNLESSGLFVAGGFEHRVDQWTFGLEGQKGFYDVDKPAGITAKHDDIRVMGRVGRRFNFGG